MVNDDAFSSHGYDYPEGEITIAGEQALWFVRERKQLPNGDLDRAKNQRNVIKAIVAKGLSARVLSDPATFTRFIGGVAKHLTVDNSLTDDEIRRTALSLRLDADDIDPAAGADLRFRHRSRRAEHRRRRHRQAGRAGQGAEDRHDGRRM